MLDDDAQVDLPFEPSLTRSITVDTTVSRLHSRHSSTEAASAASHASGLTSPRAGVPGQRVETPATYGHHRQTSIVHGIQHSRNGSVASPTTGGPLSPQMIAAAASAVDLPSLGARLEGDGGAASRAAPVGIGLQGGNPPVPPMPIAMERSASGTEMSPQSASVQRQHERSRSRREHGGHHPSASRQKQDEQKTVGEYALHVLFTSVGNFSTIYFDINANIV